jgi:hypothetical protein
MTTRTTHFLLTLAFVASACGEKIEPVQLQPECPLDPVTWDGQAGAVFAQYCTQCHSSEVGGSDRNGAPASINFNTFDEALPIAKLADKSSGEGSSMPPSDPRPTAAERKIIHC